MLLNLFYFIGSNPIQYIQVWAGLDPTINSEERLHVAAEEEEKQKKKKGKKQATLHDIFDKFTKQ